MTRDYRHQLSDSLGILESLLAASPRFQLTRHFFVRVSLVAIIPIRTASSLSESV